MSLTGMRVRYPLLSLLAVIVTSCDHSSPFGGNLGPGALVVGNGEDSWAHYQGGGLFDPGTPTLSPDGTAIVYATPCSGRGDIVRVNRGGTGRVRLAGSEDYEAHPVFSPDGSRIAYVREHGGDRHIWVMNVDGTGHTQVTTGHVMDDLVGFSADGSQIFFDRSLHTGGGGKEAEPYSVRADGTDLKRTSARPEGLVKDGVATPDGKRIYVVSRPYAQELLIRSADGTGERVLPAPRGYKLPPRLSRDGRTLLFGVYTGDKRHPDVVLIDVAKEQVVGQFSEDCEGEGVAEPNQKAP
jgi:Tol biopolymer transport system component